MKREERESGKEETVNKRGTGRGRRGGKRDWKRERRWKEGLGKEKRETEIEREGK